LTDINGDGVLDLLVSNENDGTISVLLGAGDGSFQAQTPLALLYNTPAGTLAVASLGKSGPVYLVTPDIYIPVVYVYRSNNDGTFAAPTSINLEQGPVTVITLADINHDGKPDLVAAYFGAVGIFYGNGDGTFGAEIDYSTGYTAQEGQGYITALGAADLNNDGLQDLVIADSLDGVEAILLSQEQATATAAAVYVTGTGAQVVDASYGGDTDHTASVSNTVSLQPSVQSPSAIALATSSASVAFGASVTFTATVTPAPTGATFGTANFLSNGIIIATEPVSGAGIATYTTTTLPVGTDAITAMYSGNAARAPSSSVPISEIVLMRPPPR
jgi:hypothetical protein